MNIDGVGEFHSFNLDLELWYTWCWEVDDRMTRTYYFREKKGKLKFYPIKFCCKLMKR